MRRDCEAHAVDRRSVPVPVTIILPMVVSRSTIDVKRTPVRAENGPRAPTAAAGATRRVRQIERLFIIRLNDLFTFHTRDEGDTFPR